MDDSKYERRVTMMCPTCGGEQFSYEDEGDGPVTCGMCGRQFTRDELMEANSERIEGEVGQIGKQVVDNLAKEMRKLGFK